MAQHVPTAAPAAPSPLVEATPRRRRQLSPFGRFARRVLTHPVAMAVKRPLKDALWVLRGRTLRNPPLPDRVGAILFVCKGNICRSPFAAHLAAQLLAGSGSQIRCASAGILTTQAERSPREACAAARTFGVHLEQHTPVRLTSSLVAQFDLIVVMEASQLKSLRRSYPDAAARIWLLPLLDDRIGYARYHIADPFGQPRTAFDHCYRRIDATVRNVVRLIASRA